MIQYTTMRTKYNGERVILSSAFIRVFLEKKLDRRKKEVYK